MISRRITPKRTGRRLLTAVAGLGLLSSVLLAGGTALAVHDIGVFELDTSNSSTVCAPLAAPCGNANTANDATPGDDWDQVYAGTASGHDGSFDTDPVSSAENSYYTGGGSKDVRDIPSWAYGTSNDPVPDKDDIAHAFAIAYEDPGDGHTNIYFGIDRYANNGDSETGFWFFKSPVSLNGSGGFNGTHTVGDLLVLANWGGSNPVGEVTVYQWVGGKNPLALVADSAAADCALAAAGDNYCAVVNRQTVNQAWSFTDKDGSTSLKPLELFEAGIDVFDLVGADQCFASFLAATRSSHSTTAQLKDFSLGPFEDCTSSLSTQVSDAGPVALGTQVTDDATVSVVGGASPPAPTGNVTFTISYEGGSAQAVSVENLSGATKSGNDYTVTSDPVTLDKAGTWCFSASWPGDTHYTDGPYVDDGSNECVEVSPNNPDITTQVNTEDPVTPGTPISDTASISGLYAPSAGTGGTITFNAYGPDDATCATSVYTSVVSDVTANGDYNSFADGDGGEFAPTDPGVYRWIASYEPGASDVNNTATSTECGDEHESSTVEVFFPELSTAQSWSVTDKVTITVSGGGDLSGTAYFELWQDACDTGTLLDEQNFPISGSSPQEATTTANVFDADVTLYWKVWYDSDNPKQTDIAATCTENSVLEVNN